MQNATSDEKDEDFQSLAKESRTQYEDNRQALILQLGATSKTMRTT